MLSKASENAGTTARGEQRTDTKQSRNSQSAAVDSWWSELHEPTENQLKWLQGEIPSTITDMQQQIEQLHIMLERQIHSTTDLEGQSSLWYDISDKEGQRKKSRRRPPRSQKKSTFISRACVGRRTLSRRIPHRNPMSRKNRVLFRAQSDLQPQQLTRLLPELVEKMLVE